jgi:hypothetical protein
MFIYIFGKKEKFDIVQQRRMIKYNNTNLSQANDYRLVKDLVCKKSTYSFV